MESTETNAPSYDYALYIDEAGDPGLKQVRPRSPKGASEWFIIAGALVPVEHEAEIPDWIDEITSNLINNRLPELHFAKLNDDNKLITCSIVCTKKVRFFAIISNKQNMQGYKNPLAELMTTNLPSDNWFYCWMTRVLLERATEFVANQSTEKHGRVGKVKLVLSERGGLRYSQMQAYYEFLNIKSNGGRKPLYLPWGKLDFRTLDPKLFDVYRPPEQPGLYLADIAASAFFKAVDDLDTRRLDRTSALALRSIMARDPTSKLTAGYGVKLLPGLRTLKEYNVPREKTQIFYDYGYPKQWWQAQEGR
jgi:hypothetical protein